MAGDTKMAWGILIIALIVVSALMALVSAPWWAYLLVWGTSVVFELMVWALAALIYGRRNEA